MLRLWTALQSRIVREEEEGATMVEYALMVALIAIVAIVAVTLIGTNVTARFFEVGSAVGVTVP